MKIKLFCFLFLGLSTVALALLVEQYQVTGEQVIRPGNWETRAKSPAGAQVTAGGVLLRSEIEGAYTAASQTVDLPPGTGTVLLSAEIRTRDVRKGEKPWESARLLFFQFDQNHKRLKGFHAVAGLDGTSDWQPFERAFHVDSRAADFRVVVELLKCKGEMEARHIRLYPVAVNVQYRIVQNAVLAGWALFFAGFAVVVLRRAERGPRIFLLVCIVAILFATLIPGDVKALLQQWVAQHLQTAGIGDTAMAGAMLGKAGHFVFFCSLGLLLGWALPGAGWTILVLNLLMLAAGTELAQVYVDGREAMLGDFMVDAAAGFTGLILLYAAGRVRKGPDHQAGENSGGSS